MPMNSLVSTRGIYPLGETAALLGLPINVKLSPYNASGSAATAAGASITAGQTTLSIPTANLPTGADAFLVGQGVSVPNAGALPTIAAPTAATATAEGSTGTTTISYAVAALDGLGGVTASFAFSVTDANATLSATDYVALSVTAVTGAVAYAWWRTGTNGTSPTTTGYIDRTLGTVLNDTGLATLTPPAGIPATAQTVAVGDLLVSSIVSRGGNGANTVFTLANAAVSSVGSGTPAGAVTVGHDDTAAILAAQADGLEKNRKVFLPQGQYNMTSPFATINNNSAFYLVGEGMWQSQINYSGPPTTPLLHMQAVGGTVSDIALNGAMLNIAATLLELDNSFAWHFCRCMFVGGNPCIWFVNNAGDNFISQSQIRNSPLGVYVQSLMNYINDCDFTSNDIHFQSGTGGETDGIRIADCTIEGGYSSPKSVYGIYRVSDYGEWTIDRCWFESHDTAIYLGGGYGCAVRSTRVAATTACIVANLGAGHLFSNVTTAADPSTTPQEYTLGAAMVTIESCFSTFNFGPSITGAIGSETYLGTKGLYSQIPGNGPGMKMLGTSSGAIAAPSPGTGTFTAIVQTQGGTVGFLIYLDAYYNSTTTVQSYNLSNIGQVAANLLEIVSQPAGFGASVSGIGTVVFPVSMTAAVTGLIVVMGI